MVNLREGYDFLSSQIPKEIPEYILDNLNKNFELRKYQIEAISRLIHYLEKYPERIRPTQLLFHMATGSGKTLLMASNILHLYKQGYRNFLFFVNSSNIIEKTRDNFLNGASSKYLFDNKILIDGKEVLIEEVRNFESSNPDNINIVFTTIQGLHSCLNTYKENSITYEDFKEKKIVILSDEAHHINSWTKNSLGKDEEIAKNTWEHTVSRIHQANSENIMLEYTATIDLDNPSIKEKYEPKIIYEYTLKDFRQDGFSKEVKVLQADLEPLDRALQSVIISQYRRKVAGEYQKNIKPVILMKSKTIQESKDFLEQFCEKIKNLKVKDIESLDNSSEENILHQAFKFFKEKKISLSNLISEIQEEFSEEKCLLLDSNNIDEKKQLMVNSLEDNNNEIRVIFAVDMLNEGWDVLNLFDIVRLYDTRDAKGNKPGKTTIAEAQLIGRGARYFPFKIEEEQDKYKRKYDEDFENHLRILEELYYHSAHNPKYIQELTVALRETGIMPQNPPRQITLIVKEEFKKTVFWKGGFLFSNKRQKKNNSKIKDLKDVNLEKEYSFSLISGAVQDLAIFEEGNKKINELQTKKVYLKEFGDQILLKAINQLDFYNFDNLKDYFPAMETIFDFIESLKKIKVELKSNQEIGEIKLHEKLSIVRKLLTELKREIQSGYSEFEGTKKFYQEPISSKVKNVPLNIVVDDYSDQERGIAMSQAKNPELVMDLKKKDWYIYEENYGTSEEKYFIRWLNGQIENLNQNFDEIFLLRNEKLFQIYRFSDGKPLEPDFVLFMKIKNSKKPVSYQIFIEPKQEKYMTSEGEKWKEDFLKEIEDNFNVEILSENKEFKIIGLPFYNKSHEGKFESAFSEKFIV